MTIQTHLQIVGALLFALGLSHIFFVRFFGWKQEAARMSLFTGQVFIVHCFFIALLLVLLGALSWFYASALLEPGPLSRAVLMGLVVFWFCRLIFQLFVYRSEIWRGRPFYTVMHVLFSVFWFYAVLTYGAALHSVWRG